MDKLQMLQCVMPEHWLIQNSIVTYHQNNGYASEPDQRLPPVGPVHTQHTLVTQPAALLYLHVALCQSLPAQHAVSIRMPCANMSQGLLVCMPVKSPVVQFLALTSAYNLHMA